MSNENTPLWLDIKTEYIDANLDKVISYLTKEASKSTHDAFYYETLSLMHKRVDELIEQMSVRDIWMAEEATDKKSDLTYLRILGTALLIKDSRFIVSEWHFFYFIKALTAIVPENNTEELTELAIKSLLYNVEQLGFSWSDINTIQPEVLAHKLMNVTKFSETPYSESWFQEKGSICFNGGAINVYTGNRSDKTLAKAVPSLQLQDGMILVKTAPADRIQQKDEDNIESIDKFTNDFIRESEKTKAEPLVILKKYVVGDIMPVRYTGKDVYGNYLVETVEGDYEKISGELPFNGDVFLQYYTNETVLSFFNVGDIFEAEYKGGKYKEFSIEKPFLTALIDETIETGTEKNAVLKKAAPGKPSVWWTEDGYPAYVESKNDPGTYIPGDTAILNIDRNQTNGYVYATIARPSDIPVDEEKSKQYCSEGILYEENYEPKAVPTVKTTDRTVVKGLLRLLFNYQRCITQTAERFRILSTCRILSAMTDDTISLEYIDLSCTYLKNLLAFASDKIDRIKSIEPKSYMVDIPSVIIRKKVTRLLQAYGVDKDADMLSTIIHDPNEEPKLVQLAKLIQSCNRIDDVYPAIKTVIKREITKFLSVETEDNADFEEAVGPNLGVENSRQEFKTSFFFAPSKAFEQNQEKTIFKSLCAFLNTQDGGTLYLGVNDSGGINGLDTDLEHLEKKVIGNYKGIDGYIRYITDQAKNWFDLDVRIHFKIESIYDGKVVSINVEPYQHGVVEFDGIPYIRNNSESVKMSQPLRRQIESRRLAANQERSKNLGAIAEAIREQRQVTLYRYASSSGNESIERHLEPYALVGNNAYVWAYDKDEEKNKVFRISRIGNVRIGEEWTCKQLHKKGQMDVFHCIGDTNIPVKLELDMLARNLLIEEYPDAEKELTANGDGKWILNTTVLDIHGVGRFYCGLAEHIKIIEGAQLTEYAKRYFTDGINRMK